MLCHFFFYHSADLLDFFLSLLAGAAGRGEGAGEDGGGGVETWGPVGLSAVVRCQQG